MKLAEPARVDANSFAGSRARSRMGTAEKVVTCPATTANVDAPNPEVAKSVSNFLASTDPHRTRQKVQKQKQCASSVTRVAPTD